MVLKYDKVFSFSHPFLVGLEKKFLVGPENFKYGVKILEI